MSTANGSRPSAPPTSSHETQRTPSVRHRVGIARGRVQRAIAALRSRRRPGTTGGVKAARLYRLDVASGIETALTEPDRRYALGPFNQTGTAFFANSVPLDRSTGGSTLERTKSVVTTEILRIDPIAGSSRPIAS